MVITKTPLRFSLLGGGSDLPQYFNNYGPCKIISMTLQAYIYVTLTERALYPPAAARGVYGHNIRLSYMKTETVDRHQDLEHDLIKAALEYVWRDRGSPLPFEMTTIGDVPSRGAGLGSSSALLVGVLKLFYPRDSALTLAYRAGEVEINMLKRPIGVQDQLSAAYGGLRKYVIEAWPTQLQHLAHNERGKALARWLIAFRLPANRSTDASRSPEHNTLADLRSDLAKRAKYMMKTVNMVDDAWRFITEGRFRQLDGIMQEAWRLKLLSHGVVDNQITEWYNTGIQAGAFAGKVSGSMSGGTGHLFFLCAPDKQARVLAAMPPELVPMRLRFCPHGSCLKSV